MKKILIIAMMCVFAVRASAQIPMEQVEESHQSYSFKDNFKTENNTTSFGLHFGCIGQHQDMGLQIFMGSVSVKGFYLDFGGWPQDHASDVRVDTWDADRAFLAHIGYTVPINSFIRITPVVGYALNESGTTNGHKWSATSSGIHNSFNADFSCKGFDPGCVLTINIKHFNLYGTYTRFAWYGGIGLEF